MKFVVILLALLASVSIAQVENPLTRRPDVELTIEPTPQPALPATAAPSGSTSPQPTRTPPPAPSTAPQQAQLEQLAEETPRPADPTPQAVQTTSSPLSLPPSRSPQPSLSADLPSNAFDYLLLSPVHTVFVSVIRDAKLESVFRDAKNVTIFAPTDAGLFRTLRDLRYKKSGQPEAVSQFLTLLLERQKDMFNFTRAILYHIASPSLLLEEIKPRGASFADRFVRTASGDDIEFNAGRLQDNAEAFPNSNFSTPNDLRFSNSILHSIDRLLLPVNLDREKVTLDVYELSKTFTPVIRRNETEPIIAKRRKCFPLSASVRTANGNVVKMADLRAGRSIHISENGDASAVFLFSHRATDGVHEFVRLVTRSGHTITLSHGHFLYANGRLSAASAVRVGDVLRTVDGPSRVIGLSVVRERGLVAPHTLHGDIVVDGVVASSYTTAVHPRLAQIMLAPVRAVVRLGLATEPLGAALYGGADGVARFLPAGPELY